MLVTDIEITDLHRCPRTERHTANVGVTLKDRFVTLFCQLEVAETDGPRQRAAAFVNDAMRQLRRMPEFRNGREQLDLSEGVMAKVA